MLQANRGRLLAARARHGVLHAEQGKQASRMSSSEGYTEASSASPSWLGKWAHWHDQQVLGLVDLLGTQLSKTVIAIVMAQQ